MAGFHPVLLLIIYAIIRDVAMNTAESSPGGGESSPFVWQTLCNCSQTSPVSFGCLCPDLSSLTYVQDRLVVPAYLSALPEITEFGVTCKQMVSRNTSGLFDILPASVKKLTLRDCFLHYIGKEVFYGIPNVEDLTIENLKLGGNDSESSESFPYVELDPQLFWSLPQLQKLTLDLVLFRFPKALYQEVNGSYPLPNLKSLTLKDNNILHLRPEYLQHFTNLRSLYIERNLISNVSTLFQFLPSLQILNMTSNRINSLAGSPFQNLSNLQSLDLYQQYSLDKDTGMAVGTLEFIFSTSFLGLSKLKSLRLAKSKIRSVPNGTFTELVELEQLDISDGLVDYIAASAFQGLSLLKSLDLSYNNLSEINPSVFHSLNSLISLYLQGNILHSLSRTTFESLPYLSYLNLGNNQLTNLTREIFSPLLNLKTLDVHANQLVTLEEMFSGIKSDFCEKIDASYNKVESLDITSMEILGIRGKTVNVDLSFNNLGVLYLTESYTSIDAAYLSLRLDLRWNKFTSLPFTLGTYESFKRSRIPVVDYVGLIFARFGDISLLMTQNPLICDCGLYELMLNLDVAKRGALFTKTDFKDMECAFPDELSGRKVVDVGVDELWCLEECYNRGYYCLCIEHAGKMLKSPFPPCQPERKACPSNCSCSFQGQLHSHTAPYNEKVNCARKNLSSIPDDISNVTTILHLDGNQLRVINQTVLPQLLMIRELYLNDNNITIVGDMAFNTLSSLEILRLDGNNISGIQSKVFKSLSNLRKLYLNKSGVQYLVSDTFHDLIRLQELHLENNRLQSLPENMFAGLKKLRLLGIHGNPLNCDCDILWFANWLRSRTGYLISKGRNVSCLANTKVMRDILSLSSAQLDCDDLQAAQARIRLIVGLSIVFVLVTIVLVCVIVIMKRKEAIQVYLYARYGWRFKEEEEDEDKEFDAFLSYSQHDLDVVLHDVLPALENRELPFHVCLHHRDFLPGASIAENILNAVSASKRTVILLSNNFLESDWCQLEFQAAHAQMLQDRANRVIVVLLDDVPAENTPPDIQHYLDTNTYLKWGDERFWERLIYAMPRPRPHAQDVDGDQLAMVELDHNR